MRNYKQILTLVDQGFSQHFIAENLHVSRDTIRDMLKRIKDKNISVQELLALSNEEISNLLYPPKEKASIYVEPDVEYLASELSKKGVTVKLLWEEYCDKCKEDNKIALSYTPFKKRLNDYTRINQATMHYNHTPAKAIEVDWAGTTINIANPIDGTLSKAYLFVGVLPYSQYTYAEFTNDMKEENWINVHVNMFNFFGGVTPMIISDNLKTGVISNPKKGDPVINQYYEELANYYNTAIVPANPLTPKGKASVEGMVGKLTTSIIASMRNDLYNSVHEANVECLKLLDKFNNKPFQKREGSRYEVFTNEEKMHLLPLPIEPFEYGEWKLAKVQKNYHILVNKQYYSVPYDYIGKDVKVKVTKRIVYIYLNDQLICSHIRATGRDYQYTTKESHLPSSHIKANSWNSDYFKSKASEIGPNTLKVVTNNLKSYKYEAQGYKGINSLLHLADDYGKASLEEACTKGLTLIANPRYIHIKRILLDSQVNKPTNEDNKPKGFVRGANYFNKGDK